MTSRDTNIVNTDQVHSESLILPSPSDTYCPACPFTLNSTSTPTTSLTPSAPPAPMCRVIQWLHPQCGHLKRYEPIPSSLCPTYIPSLLPSSPCGQTLITHTNHVAFPLLCIPCFRLAERLIDEEADRIIEEKMTELADVERDIEDVIAVADLDMLEELNVVALRLEREVREAEGWRGKEIRTFRASQGVWGDG